MKLQTAQFCIDSRQCYTFWQGQPQFLILQPVDEHDAELLAQQTEIMVSEAPAPFMLVAFQVKDWNRELSPWEAPPVFGKEAFGNGAADTLDFVLHQLIPTVTERYPFAQSLPVILGGYSLAGLFALWSAYRTDCFAAIAGVSPSVWFPGWIDFAKANKPQSRYIYLSLGDREEKAKNQVMATVGDNIRLQQAILTETPNVVSVLEWNEGNHFQNSDKRCAKGFLWCMKRLIEES